MAIVNGILVPKCQRRRVSKSAGVSRTVINGTLPEGAGPEACRRVPEGSRRYSTVPRRRVPLQNGVEECRRVLDGTRRYSVGGFQSRRMSETAGRYSKVF